MLRNILTYGGIGGLIAGSACFGIAVLRNGVPVPYGVAVGYLTMLVALSTIFVAIKRRRDVDQGGVIRFWPAFGMGLAISAVAGLLYVIAWEAALAVLGMDRFFTALIEAEQNKGVRGPELARFATELRAFRASYENPFVRLPITFSEIFPVGVLVSLLSAALLRDSRFLPARSSDHRAGATGPSEESP